MVEILLAVYNGERFLREQLDSLLSQTYPDWHLTMSDDGSTDGTSAILDEYAARYPDRMARVYHGKRFGNARDHFFWLMEQCDALYMMFCDQDDVWNTDKVEIIMRALLDAEGEHGEDTPILVFTDLMPVDEHLKPIASSLMRMQKQDASHIDYRALLFQNIVTGCATGFNRALAVLGGQCVDIPRVIMHDWWLAAVAARFGKMVYLDVYTMRYRQHEDNSVGAKHFGSASYVLGMLKRLSSVKEQILRKKEQARIFQKTYAPKLTERDQTFLEQYMRPRSGLPFYIRHRKLFTSFWRLTGMAFLG